MSQIYNPQSGGGGGGSAVETITGNTGGAQAPVGNNFNIVTANSTPIFTSTPGNNVLDFALTNLVLGSSLPALTSGANNVGLGSGVFSALTSGSGNVGGGTLAFQSINSGSNNVVWGFGAGRFITSGSGNMLFGTSSGASLTTGNNNVGMGSSTLGSYTTGTANAGSNLAIGTASLANLTTGTFNIALGANSGSSYSTSESSNLLFSNTGVVAESNTTRIGTQGTGDGQQNRAFIAGVAGVSVSDLQMVTIDSTTGQLGSTSGVLFTLKSSLIDMTSGTVQALFTSPSYGTFVATSIVEYGQNVTGYVSPAVFNIGWTAPNYDDLTLTSSTQVDTTNKYSVQPAQGAALPIPIPPSTSVSINITAAASATTMNENFYLIGYILY
jgi:hypothetical protein